MTRYPPCPEERRDEPATIWGQLLALTGPNPDEVPPSNQPPKLAATGTPDDPESEAVDILTEKLWEMRRNSP